MMQHQIFLVQDRQEEHAVFPWWDLEVGFSGVATWSFSFPDCPGTVVHELSSAPPDGVCVQEGLHL